MPALRACIHRGAAQVGGSCIELEAGGARLLLDLGMPLDAEDGDAPLPDVAGLRTDDPSLLGVLVTHLHGDHCGLVPYARPGLALGIGASASRILREAEFFTGRPPLPEPAWHLEDRRPFEIGPFRITPYQVEHSAFDAFALLVEAGGRRLFYTGDFRAHGNDREPFERLLRDPPRDVHALLMEGTQLGGGREPDGRSEDDLRRQLARELREWPGLVLVAWSSQNLDRLRTVFEATREAGRALVVDLYTATLARAAGAEGVPRLGEPGLLVFPRKTERLAVKAAKEFDRTGSVWHWRIGRELLARRGRELVVMFRPSMVPELERAGALRGARAFWSLWRGYLQGPSEQRMLRSFDRHGVKLEVRHVTGHAYPDDLRRLRDAVQPGRVVPIHTEEPDAYPSLLGAADLKRDGEWWEV